MAEAKDTPAIMGALCDSGNEKEEQLLRRFGLSLPKQIPVNLRERRVTLRQPLVPHTKCLLTRTRELIWLVRRPRDGRPLNC